MEEQGALRFPYGLGVLDMFSSRLRDSSRDVTQPIRRQISLASVLLAITIIAAGLALLTQVTPLDGGLAVTGLVTAAVLMGYGVYSATACLLQRMTTLDYRVAGQETDLDCHLGRDDAVGYLDWPDLAGSELSLWLTFLANLRSRLRHPWVGFFAIRGMEIKQNRPRMARPAPG